jgi:hypothetical protein
VVTDSSRKRREKGSRAWLIVYPALLLVFMLLVVVVAPVFAWRGHLGPVHWYTQVSSSLNSGPGFYTVENRWSRGWTLRLWDWNWFVGVDKGPGLHPR